MEYTKLTLEMTSPEWTSYFQALPGVRRAEVQAGQAALSKGISSDTINAIFDELYRREALGGVDTTLLTATEVRSAQWDGERYTLDLHHTEQDVSGRMTTESLVLATGYQAASRRSSSRSATGSGSTSRGGTPPASTFAVSHTDDVFVQNGEEHTHGFVAPDLGMGALPQLGDPRRRAGPRGLPRREADRLPGVRHAGPVPRPADQSRSA